MAKKKTIKATKKVTSVVALDRREQIDRAKLVQSGQAKLSAGQTPNRKEDRAIRQCHAGMVDLYGGELVAFFPKGRFYKETGLSAKVVIDQCRAYGAPWPANQKTINVIGWMAWAFGFFTEHSKDLPKFLSRKQRATRLRETGDGEEDADYDHYDARRVRAIALINEFKLDQLVSNYAHVDLFDQIIRSALEGHIRGMMDDYSKREMVAGREVVARLSRMLKEIYDESGEVLEPSGSGESDPP